MIELLRYARLKPDGLASARLMPDGDVAVEFKRFSVENGKELEPEESVFPFASLEARLSEVTKELEVLRELIALKSR